MVPVQSHVTRKQCKEDLNPGTVSSEPEGCSEDEVEVRNLGFTFRPVEHRIVPSGELGSLDLGWEHGLC